MSHLTGVQEQECRSDRQRPAAMSQLHPVGSPLLGPPIHPVNAQPGWQPPRDESPCPPHQFQSSDHCTYFGSRTTGTHEALRGSAGRPGRGGLYKTWLSLREGAGPRARNKRVLPSQVFVPECKPFGLYHVPETSK